MFGHSSSTPLSKFTASSSAIAIHPGASTKGISPHDVAPPGVDPQVLSQFHLIDTDQSGYITATELQSALRNGGWPPFEIDTIKLLMSMFDTNRNGTIDINEFDGLWKYIKDWENIFRRFDKNHNNAIDGDELHDALKYFGYELSPPLQDLLKRKYDVSWASGRDPAAGGRSAPSGISFDRFMRACILVKQLKESFESLDRDAYGQVKIGYDTLLSIVFKLP